MIRSLASRVGPVVAAAAVFLAVVTAVARAGQVRVDIVGFEFQPRAVNCNMSDHVIWLSTSSFQHTVTSGDSGTATPDGTFDSGPMGAGAAFSWKSDRTGAVLYYSLPYVPSVAGRVLLASSGIDVADLRITEVQYNVPGGADLIEVANLGEAGGDLGRFRLAINGSQVHAVTPVNVPIAPGDRVTLHVNASGTNTATDVYLPTAPSLPDTGSLGLYVPNSSFSAGFSDATQIVDFVQWSAGGGPNEATAATAGLWTAGDYLPRAADGHSVEFCGTAADRGMTNWAEIALPNFGSNGMCTTPVRKGTWGRLKTLYR